MGKTIEIFTDRKLYGNELIELVEQYACPKCKVHIYDASNRDDEAVEIQEKAAAYGIAKMPAIVMDGKEVPIERLKKKKLSNAIHSIVGKRIHRNS